MNPMTSEPRKGDEVSPDGGKALRVKKSYGTGKNQNANGNVATT